MARNQPELPKDGVPSEVKRKIRRNHDVDEQVEDSFPASDPPSYAGGAHAGAPAQHGGAPSKSHKKKD